MKFTIKEEEQIIEFVKKNEVLYNSKHRSFRDNEAKSRLWHELANKVNKDDEAVKKKWIGMRDYFVRNRNKHAAALAATMTKRDESLMFLLDSPKSDLSNVSSLENTSSIISNRRIFDNFLCEETANETSQSIDIKHMTEIENETTDNMNIPPIFSDETSQQSRKRKNDTNPEDLQEFLNQRLPNPLDFLPLKLSQPKDNLDQFFESIASTMRTFTPLSIAKIKLQISQIVGEEEINCAKKLIDGENVNTFQK